MLTLYSGGSRPLDRRGGGGGGGGGPTKKKIWGPSDLSLVEKLGGRVPCDPPLDPPLLYRIAFHADTKS